MSFDNGYRRRAATVMVQSIAWPYRAPNPAQHPLVTPQMGTGVTSGGFFRLRCKIPRKRGLWLAVRWETRLRSRLKPGLGAGNRRVPNQFDPPSDSSRATALLLRHRLDHVPDFKGGTGNRGANRGLIIDIGDFEHADGRSHLANHFAGRRILDLMRHP